MQTLMRILEFRYMANFSELRAEIKAQIKPNGEGAITGQVMQDTMLSVVDTTDAILTELSAETNRLDGQINGREEITYLLSDALKTADWEQDSHARKVWYDGDSLNFRVIGVANTNISQAGFTNTDQNVYTHVDWNKSLYIKVINSSPVDASFQVQFINTINSNRGTITIPLQQGENYIEIASLIQQR